MANGCKFTFSSGIRGFHVYGKTWSRRIGQKLQTVRESTTMQKTALPWQLSRTVRHISRELSSLLSRPASAAYWKNVHVHTVTASPTMYRDVIFVNIMVTIRGRIIFL